MTKCMLNALAFCVLYTPSGKKKGAQWAYLVEFPFLVNQDFLQNTGIL